jgi:YgiT-type zinc finger domain-containing protein
MDETLNTQFDPAMLKITTCPTCGSKRIRRVVRTIRGARTGKAFTVAIVSVEECPVCGEMLFDHAALQKIEEHQRRRTKAPPTRKAS